MTLRGKLLLALLIPGLLLVAVGIVGISSLRQLEDAAGHILSNNYQSIRAAREMESALRRLEGARPGTDAAARDAFEGGLALCERNVTELGEPAILASIRATWERLDGPDGLGGDRAARDRLVDGISALVAVNERAMLASERETRRTARFMRYFVAGALAAAVLTLAAFALLAAGRISRPVRAVADRLHQALNPVEDAAVPALEGDEIARLESEVDSLLGRLLLYEHEQAQRLTHLQGRLALVMNEVLEGLVLLDGGLRVLAVNRVARTLLGTPGGEGVRLSELPLRPDLREALDPLMEGTFQPERDLGEVRFVIDGSERVYRPRVVTVSGSGAPVEGYLLLFWDVTEQRRFEESRRRFISMLSHQLKTPMTSLSMSVNLLRERLTGVPDAQAELLTIATEDCANLAGLISELIEAAHEVTPDLSIRPQRVDLAVLLRSALRPLLPQAEALGIHLLLPETSVMVQVDPVKFPWVVTNIAGNALRYTSSGGTVAVRIARGGSGVEVTVSDTGRGIAAEALPHIFEPFVSADREPQAGTHGLGLAIAKEIVLAHRGTVSVESRQGEGTTFRICVPAVNGERT